MSAPFRNNDSIIGRLSESFVLNQMQMITQPAYERDVLVRKNQNIEDVFGVMGVMRQAGFLQFRKEGHSAQSYYHVEAGENSVDYNYAATAAPVVGSNVFLTITGDYGSDGTTWVNAGDQYYTSVGILGTVISVNRATPFQHIVELESVPGTPWPNMPAGKMLYSGHSVGESAYAPSRTMMKPLAAFDHIPQRVAWSAGWTNFTALSQPDWLNAPNVNKRGMASPWLANMPSHSRSGWLDAGLDDSINNELKGVMKLFFLGQRAGTPRSAGNKFHTDGMDQVIDQQGIVLNAPTVATRSFFENVHSAKADVNNSSRDIRVTAGVSLCNVFNAFAQSEMNGSVLVDRNSPYDYTYSGFKGLYGDSMFTWMNFTPFDDQRGLGAMGWKSKGYAIEATLPEYLEYTGNTPATRPNATLVTFRPDNSKIMTDAAGNASFLPIHYGTHAGLDFVETGSQFSNGSTNTLDIHFGMWFATDFRCMALSTKFQ